MAGLAVGAIAGLLGRFIGTAAGKTATSTVGTIARPAIVAGGRLAGRIPTQVGGSTARGIATRGGIAVGGGAAFAGGAELFERGFGGGQGPVGIPGQFTGGGAGGGPFQLPEPGMQFGTSFVTRTWTTDPNTGFPFFAKLADGRIVVTRRDGSLKSYRPKKPIVLSSKPTVKQAVRAQKQLNRVRSSIKKEFKLTERK